MVVSQGVSDADAVTITVNTSAATSVPLGSVNSSSGSLRLMSPRSGVSKPVRRRSRASRRTPTTLLNTDTANFRAMVQQFTGGPSVPFASGSGQQISSPNTFRFGTGGQRRQVDPSEVLVPAAYRLQYQLQQPQQQQHLQYQQPSLPSYMFSFNNSMASNPPVDDGFLQRIARDPRPSSMEVSTGLMLAEDVSSLQLAPASSRPESSSNIEEHRNTFLF